jgi:DNA repair exonuclease SbcCD ATPase subunit
MAYGIAKAAVTLVLLTAIPQVHAEIYRWVDDQGVTHFSTTPPPETSQRERQVYDREGRGQQQIKAPPTEADLEREREAREQERIEAERQAMEQERQRAEMAVLQARMRQLDQAYSGLDDIREQRDRRLEQIAATLEMSDGFVATLEAERDRISTQIQRHTGDNGTLERYRGELADLERRLEREREHQERQRAMMAEIEANAARDLADYERLVLPLRERR